MTDRFCLSIYVSWSTSELRVRLVHRLTGLSTPVKYFYWPFQRGASLWIIYVISVLFCYTFMHFCLLMPCGHLLGRADLLAFVCDVYLWRYHFPIGILVQKWCLTVSIPDLCPLSYLANPDDMSNYATFNLVCIACRSAYLGVSSIQRFTLLLVYDAVNIYISRQQLVFVSKSLEWSTFKYEKKAV